MFRFRLFGIPFVVHPTFWLFSALLGAGVAQGQDAITNLLIWVVCAFFSVAVHELGHATAARHYGAEPGVELRDLGGVTRLYGRSLTRAEGFWMTLAGPAAGFALYLVASGIWTWFYRGWLPHVYALGGQNAAFVMTQALTFLKWMNLVWTLFNLLPILPLDGGLMLNALLGPRRFGVTQGIGIFLAGSLAVLALLLWKQPFVAFFLAYLAFANFRGNPRVSSGGVSQ